MSTDKDTSAAVIEPNQILGLIESFSHIGNKSVQLQRTVNEFVSEPGLNCPSCSSAPIAENVVYQYQWDIICSASIQYLM